MTVEQRQHLLAYLGYLSNPTFGVWDTTSSTACRQFQESFGGIAVDGICGPETQKALKHAVAYGMDTKETTESSSFWDDIEYFERKEFKCQCGGKYCNGFPVEPQEHLVRIVDEIRRRLGVPVSIVDAGGSGVRCATHNRNVGGVSNSWHLYGRAADLHSSATPARMYAVAEEVLGNTGGIGLYNWGIHVDDGAYSRWVN